MNQETRQIIADKIRRGDNLPLECAQELFPSLHFSEKKEYELIYEGKEREQDVIANTLAVPLQKVRTFGKNGKDWHNMLIFGENLQVLKRLVELKKAGKLLNADGTPGVRLVYIDPPFATRQEFRGSKEQKAYSDKLVNSQFLEFIRQRLILIRELLSDDGSLYLHCDWRMNSHMRLLCEEVFQKERFQNELIWAYSRMASKGQMKFNNTHQTIYWLRKGSKFVFNVDAVRTEYAEGSKNRAGYAKKGVGSGLLKEGALCELNPLGKFPDDWFEIPFERNPVYPTQKPEALLQKIISASSNQGDIVLDAFAGSGTTLSVAEKLQRRWIGVDCGKLSIYTIQKRLLNISTSKDLFKENRNYTKELSPFDLHNAGLYDFSKLKELSREDWRFFALQLFECKDDPHTIGGIHLDGKRKGGSVLVFDHHSNPDKQIDEETVKQLHASLGNKIGSKFFIIAQKGAFAFQQDYLDLGGVRYYALRIPYSFINELHRKEFKALKQPNDLEAVNETVNAVGFDFIQPPAIDWSITVGKRPGQFLEEVCLRIKKFESRARLRGEDTKGGLETFSTLMVDFAYDGKVFDMDHVEYAQGLKENEWEAWFPKESIGEKVMLVFIDIYGNESAQVKTREEIGLSSKKAPTKKAATRKHKKAHHG